MYDRLVRCDLTESDRFIDLPNDTHRLVFICLLFQADDFGNLDGNPRRLFRWTHTFSQVKEEHILVTILSALCDADLLRRYEADGRPYFHVPRFNNHRRYTSRKHPRSPWCDANALATVERMHHRNTAANLPQVEQSPLNQGSVLPIIGRVADDDPQVCTQVSADDLRGVGVEEGRGSGKTARATRLPKDWTIPEEWIAFAVNHMKDKGFHVQESKVIEWSLEFADYWHSAPKGTKLDWFATWRNRVRNQDTRGLPTIASARPALRGI